MINQTNFKFMEKKILYHIGLYGFRKLIVYVIMVGVIIWLIVVLLICFSVFGGLWLLPIYLLFCLALGFYFGVKYLTI